MSEAGIKRNQVILPNDKNRLIDSLKNEINLLKKDIDEKKLSGAALQLALRHREQLQDLLNRFMTKKGVFTPQETNEYLDALDESKKIRLAKEFRVGINRFTTNIIIVVLLGAALIYLIKKSAKK